MRVVSTGGLTPTSYVVLGLLELGGPSTSYDFKQRVAGSIGNFWSFPHTQLYSEPARLVDLGLVSEEREETGRRRRIYSITDAGREALRDWLTDPATGDLEIRDPGLLRLFFGSAVDAAARRRLAATQRDVHTERLAAYEQLDASFGDAASPQRDVLRLGLAVERAYVDFWSRLADRR